MIYQTTRIAGAIAAAAALAACAPQAAAPPVVDTAKDVAALKAGAAEYNANYKARAVDKLVAGTAADAIAYLPFEPVQNGPGDAKAMAAQFAADPAMALTVTPGRIEVAKSGDLAYAVGHIETTSTNPKTHAIEHATSGDVVVFRKQADGTWKVVALAVSPGPPPPGSAKP
jgi:ketosteroid isomerase-like protein